MKAVVDTGPLLAAADTSQGAHELARAVIADLAPTLVVLDTVATETDYMLRTRIGPHAARLFLAALVAGEHTAGFMTPGLLRRAAEIDARFADLDLGLVDASVMAYAERHKLPILTFDFEDFRATSPARGHWNLLVDEALYEKAIRARRD